MNTYQIFSKRNIFRNLSVNTILVLINILMFILISILIAINPSFLNYFALKPSNILQGKYLWTLLTSMFTHVYFWHLAFNMISLFFVGTLVEKIIGSKRYLFFYLIAGIFGGIAFALLAGFLGGTPLGANIFGSPDIVGVGASGAIFGLIGLLALLTPKNRIYLIAGPLIAIIIESVLANLLPSGLISVIDLIVTIYVFASLFAMFSFNPFLRKVILPINLPFWILPIISIVPLVIIGIFVALPIGNSAHFGGLIIGLIYGLFLKYKYPRKTQMISKIFSK